MQQTKTLELLAVGLAPAPSPGLDAVVAVSGREALAALRLLHVDLLLAGHHIPDMSVWAFIRRARIARPQLRWALVSNHADDREEIAARALGALCVFAGTPDLDELAPFASGLRIGPSDDLVAPGVGWTRGP